MKNISHHASNRSRDILESEQILRTFFNEWDDGSLLSRFLTALKNDRPRYYRKSITSMAALLTDYDKATAHTLLEMFAESKVYNANSMKEIAGQLADRMENLPKARPINIGLSAADITPEKRSINEYKDIIGKDEEDK